MIDWVICQKFKFDHTNKWYIRSPESVLENKTRKLLWNDEMQMGHLISAKQSDLVIVNKNKRENLPNNKLGCPVRSQNRIKRR